MTVILNKNITTVLNKKRLGIYKPAKELKVMKNWVHVPATEHHGHVIEDEHTGRTVCDLYFINKHFDGLVDRGPKYFEHDDAEEHACLLVAAPAMHEALKPVLKRLDALVAFYVTEVGASYPEIEIIRQEQKTIVDILLNAHVKPPEPTTSDDGPDPEDYCAGCLMLKCHCNEPHQYIPDENGFCKWCGLDDSNHVEAHIEPQQQWSSGNPVHTSDLTEQPDNDKGHALSTQGDEYVCLRANCGKRWGFDDTDVPDCGGD